jgi:hypothetical protein
MSGSSLNRAIQSDTSKYVEQRIFDDYKGQVQRDFDTVNAKIEELRQLIEDIIAILKTKASEKDRTLKISFYLSSMNLRLLVIRNLRIRMKQLRISNT